MAYSPYTPFTLNCTGLVSTVGAIDFATVALPVSGIRYAVHPYVYFYNIASTGIPNNLSFNLATGAAGTGLMISSDFTFVSLASPSGMTLYAGNPSNWFTAPNITVRQTAASATTGLIGVRIGILPLL